MVKGSLTLIYTWSESRNTALHMVQRSATPLFINLDVVLEIRYTALQVVYNHCLDLERARINIVHRKLEKCKRERNHQFYISQTESLVFIHCSIQSYQCWACVWYRYCCQMRPPSTDNSATDSWWPAWIKWNNNMNGTGVYETRGVKILGPKQPSTSRGRLADVSRNCGDQPFPWVYTCVLTY